MVTLVPVMRSTAPVCVTRSGTDPVAMPIVLKVRLATTGGCATRHPTCVCNETFGGPSCNVRSCPHSPLHSSYLEGGTDRFAPVSSLTVGIAGEWLPTGKVAKRDLPLF